MKRMCNHQIMHEKKSVKSHFFCSQGSYVLSLNIENIKRGSPAKQIELAIKGRSLEKSNTKKRSTSRNESHR